MRGIVDGLAAAHSTPRSWWDAVKAWLQTWFDKDKGSFAWLDRLLGRLAPTAGLLTLVLYGLLAAVLCTAVGYVIVELRAEGAFSRRRSRATAGLPLPARSGAPESRTMLESAPAADQPAILLRLLVDVLTRKGRLRADRHLTHRELVRCVALGEGQRAQFARVAELAEGLLYGPDPSPQGIGAIVEGGCALLTQLEVSSAAA